ncbi:MAG TPA: peptide deformylase [Candidatus Dormibacteraeota bacterium]|nr:peptide deformylase [Candidatus Dormibacteraeota bacterium]
MTKDDIIALPNPHLRQKSKRVGMITDKIRQVVADMEAATLDWDQSREHEVGVALAAVQIDRLYKIVVIRNNYNDKNDHGFTAFINPEITKLEGEVVEDFEGCLSVPSIYGKVPRHSKVRVKALNLNGKQFRVTADGFLARVFQHEIDHCEGLVFIDHIKDKPEAFFKLDDEGKLKPLDYEKDVEKNPILW